MRRLVSDIRRRARRVARAAAFTVSGIIFGLVGMAFLTVVLWMQIAEYQSAVVAHGVIGAIYLMIGFLLLALGGNTRDAEDAASEDRCEPREPLLQIAEAFAIGMQAGRTASKKPQP